ncbi:hypothetical protein [Photobacterium damselae]
MPLKTETLNNIQAKNLVSYVDKYKAKFDERLAAYNAIGQLDWDSEVTP